MSCIYVPIRTWFSTATGTSPFWMPPLLWGYSGPTQGALSDWSDMHTELITPSLIIAPYSPSQIPTPDPDPILNHRSQIWQGLNLAWVANCLEWVYTSLGCNKQTGHLNFNRAINTCLSLPFWMLCGPWEFMILPNIISLTVTALHCRFHHPAIVLWPEESKVAHSRDQTALAPDGFGRQTPSWSKTGQWYTTWHTVRIWYVFISLGLRRNLGRIIWFQKYHIH